MKISGGRAIAGLRTTARPRRNDMSTVTLDHPLLTIEIRRRAQVMVASHALSTADCAELLDMLGIAGVE